eukprot:UN20604
MGADKIEKFKCRNGCFVGTESKGITLEIERETSICPYGGLAPTKNKMRFLVGIESLQIEP